MIKIITMKKKKLTHNPDTRIIYMDDDYQIDYWSKQLGVKRARLVAAVEAVGGSIADVKRQLKYKSQENKTV